METITAKKGRMRKKFLKKTWDLLPNKNGWTEVQPDDQVVENISRKSTPDSGQKQTAPAKEQVVKNVAEVQPDDQVVENEVKTENKESAVPSASPEFSTLAKANLSASRIKNYFDSEEGKTAYKNTMKLDALIDLLAVKLSNSTDALKSTFSIEEGGAEL